MRMKFIGKTTEEAAHEFVKNHEGVALGSKSADGSRRVIGVVDSERRKFLSEEFLKFENSKIVTIQYSEEPTECIPCKKNALGDKIKDRLIKESGDQAVCKDCQDEIDRLNNMTPEEVVADSEEIARNIRIRAAKQAKKRRHRVAATIAPNFVEGKVRQWIQEEVNQLPEENVEP